MRVFPALTALALLAGEALAQPAVPTLPQVIVSATRLPTPESEIASSVTVITAEEIERRQLRTLPEVLSAVPGVSLVQAGGIGGPTAVFLRGTNSNHTKVLVDGIDVSDPSSPNGAFDLAHVLAHDIERVEILRGPQSGLYGSDAIGGVILITTRRGGGRGTASASAEVGSFGTMNQSAGARGVAGRLRYAGDLVHLRSTDVPVTPERLLPPGRAANPNTYDNLTASARLDADVTDRLALGFVGRVADGSARFTQDDFSTFPSTPAASRSQTDTRQLFARATATLSLLDGDFEQTLGLAYTGHRRRDDSPDTGFGATTNHNRGQRFKLDWQGDLRIAEDHTAIFGLEAQEDEIEDSPITASVANRAGFAQLQSRFGERLFTAVNLRHDDHERFGGETTWRIAPAFLVPETGTRLKASYGTGFKAPTLNQLFVSFPAFRFFANPDLKPERSRGYDIGIEQSIGSRLRVGTTYFHSNIEDLITLTADGSSLENRPTATVDGVESFIAFAATDRIDLRLDHTYTVAVDDATASLLLRRPRHKLGLDASWRIEDGPSLSLTVLRTGDRVDGNRDFSIPRLTASGYTVVTLAATYAASEQLTLFGRLTNLLDQRYEDPTGFEGQGLGVFAGARLRF